MMKLQSMGISKLLHTTDEHPWPDIKVEWKKKQRIEVFDMTCSLDCSVTEKEKNDRGLQPTVLRLTTV